MGAAYGNIVSHRDRQLSKFRSIWGWNKLLLGAFPLVFLTSYALRPDTVTNFRSGEGILSNLSNIIDFNSLTRLPLPEKFYGAIQLLLPIAPKTIGQWDTLIAVVGFVILTALFSSFSNYINLRCSQFIALLSIVGLSGIYIFMLNKDFVQLLIFLIAYQVAMSQSLNDRKKIGIVVIVFLLEYLVWRSYFVIVALFVPATYVILRRIAKMRTRESLKWTKSLVFFFSLFAVMLVFLYVLRAISPANYMEVVFQHSSDREAYTTIGAASGIRSFITLGSGSAPYLYAINHVINFVRLLFPVELILKSPKYLPFFIYQCFISWFILKGLISSAYADDTRLIVLSVIVAFVIASATFEPDYGSWTRHETAAMPFLVAMLCLDDNTTAVNATVQHDSSE